MKKKLNMFCALIFVVLVCDILLTLNVMFTGALSGYNTAKKMEDTERGSSYDYYTIALLPTELTDRNAKTIVDETTGKKHNVWPTQLIVPANGKADTTSKVFAVVEGVVSLTLGVTVLVSFFCFVRNVNRCEIFTNKNTKHLRRIGWSMIATGIIVTANYCYDTYVAQRQFDLVGYIVDYSDSVYLDFILFGLFSLVMAEAFAIGLKMKEEQELTI